MPQTQSVQLRGGFKTGGGAGVVDGTAVVVVGAVVVDVEDGEGIAVVLETSAGAVVLSGFAVVVVAVPKNPVNVSKLGRCGTSERTHSTKVL